MDYKDLLTKAGLQGGLVSLASCYYIFRGTSIRNLRITTLGSKAPLWLATFGLGSVGSLASDGLHQLVKDEVPVGSKSADQASLIIGSLVSAGVLTAGLYLLNKNALKEYGLWNAVMVGGLSELGASFGTNLIYQE